MFKFEIANGVAVWIDVEQQDYPGLMQFDGDPSEVRATRRELLRSFGLFGHLMNERTTPQDLHYALSQFPISSEQVEGDPINYKSGIPPGAVT